MSNAFYLCAVTIVVLCVSFDELSPSAVELGFMRLGSTRPVNLSKCSSCLKAEFSS